MLVPNYKQGILATMNAVREYVGIPTYHKSEPMIQNWLIKNQFEQVTVMLIDGMGADQIARHCNENGFFKMNYVKTIDTVYPPTTVAATTSVLTGKAPCETAWLGWKQYFSDIEQNIEMFTSINYYTRNRLDNKTFTYQQVPVKNMIDECNEIGIPARQIFPAWKENGAEDFQELCEKVVEESHEQKNKLIYAYWDEYDSCMHKNGESNKKSIAMLQRFDEILEETMLNLSSKTGLIIIADHGHVDVKNTFYLDYPDVLECFDKLPSLETRTINFHIKEDKKEIFEELFMSYFQNQFILLTKKEVVEKKLFGEGNIHPKFESFLGDYIACATGNISIDYDHRFALKGSHAGMTKEEIEIPLILYNKDR